MKKSRKSTPATPDPSVFVKQIDSALKHERYQEAVDLYKQLLKRERRPEWVAGLADSYLARARQLAAKGMYREAAALWENRAGSCATQVPLDCYLTWLLRSGRAARAARLLVEADEVFRQSTEGQRVTTELAVVLAAGQVEVIQALPADHPLRQQQAHVAAALRACCQGDDAALREHLKPIPHRSPFHDWRVILQALPLAATEPTAAADLLGRVAIDSPFSPVARLVEIAVLEGERLWAAVTDLEPPAREFILTLKGWEAPQIRAVNELLARSGDETTATAKTLFKAICSRADMFEATVVRRYCRALLPDYPQGMADYEKRFGALPPPERNRLAALAAERRTDWHIAAPYWNRYIEHLTRTELHGDDALRAALALRHLADLTLRIDGPDPWNETVQNYLTRSLELDPADKATHLSLIGMAQHRDDTKAQDRLLEQAVRRFPEDPDILMAAAMAAHRRGAFKKAAGLAAILLERDPINRSARNMMLSSHLAHARKQINAGKPGLAAKELEIAKAFAQEDDQRGVLELNEGFMVLLAGSQESAQPLLQRAYRHLGGGVVAEFRFLVDGGRIKLHPRTLTAALNRTRDETQRPAAVKDILLLAELIGRYLSDGVKNIERILERLRAPLSAAASLDYTERELQGICAALQQADHHELLQEYAEAALKRWPQRPVFVCYALAGRTRGRSERLSWPERQQLDAALNKAHEEGDHAVVKIIEDFYGLPSFGFGGLPLDLPAPLQDLFDEITDGLDPDDPEDFISGLEELLRRIGAPMPGERKRKR